MLKVKVFGKVESRTVGEREFKSQFCTLDCGEDLPGLRFVIPVDEPLAAGDYLMGPECFTVGKYERLELNGFAMARSLVRAGARPAAAKAA